jgi:hypothetical protein
MSQGIGGQKFPAILFIIYFIRDFTRTFFFNTTIRHFPDVIFLSYVHNMSKQLIFCYFLLYLLSSLIHLFIHPFILY